MSLSNLTTNDKIQQQGDSLGGFILDSDAYEFAIDMAYVDESQGGATSVNFLFKGKNGQSLRQTIYVTSGKAKGQKHTYTDKTGNEQYLPGFSQVNNICLLAIGKELSAIPTETKTISIYDYTQKKELPQEREVMMELLGAEITLGVIKQIVDKNVKNDAGVYVASGETREENEIDKAFRTKDGLTAAEIRAESTEAAFLDKWIEKNKGVVRNKAKGAKAGATGSTDNAGAPAGGTTKSLF